MSDAASNSACTGYVVMPEHVHLLVGEPNRETVSHAMKSLKQGLSRRLIGDAEHFWQKRYYDFNIRNHGQFEEELHYSHRNPVKRGLCGRPEDGEWSSLSSMRPDVKGASKLNPSGRQEIENGQREDSD